MIDDRREFIRLKYSAPLGFKICNKETISKLCAGYTVDISQSGLLCNISERVKQDDILWLSFDRSTLDFCRELDVPYDAVGKVVVAKTEEEIARGLMFRENLEQDKGMLFIFQEEGEYSFWMKNTLIPLDIIWINKNKEVVFISGNTQPCKEYACPDIDPAKNAKYVLEINGNISKNIGLKVGDIINLKIE